MKKTKLAIVAASTVSLLVAGSAYAGVINTGNPKAPVNQTPNPGQNAQPQRQNRGGMSDKAQAGPRGPQQGLFHGKVSTIDGNNLVFEQPTRPQRSNTATPTAPTTIKVATDASTQFIVTGVASPSLANVKAGDLVTVLLQKPVDRAALKAASVFVAPLPSEVHVGGKVENASATGFSVKSPRGTDKVNVSASTKIIILGKLDGSIADIANGDNVQVIGKPSSTSTVEASQIIKQNTDAAYFGGQIVVINGNIVTIWSPQGDQVNVDMAKANFANNRTVADLKVGQHLAGAGVKNTDGSITAQIIGGGKGIKSGPGANSPKMGGKGGHGQGDTQRGPNGPQKKKAPGTGV